MQIKVTSNVGPLTKALDAFGKKQIPFATSMALNDAAFAVRKEIVERTYPASFTVKSQQFARQVFRVKKSTKHNLVSEVFDRFEKDYLANQAEGGIKEKRGRYIAIPGRDRPVIRGKATYRRVHPRVVLDRPKSFTQTVRGQDMILERRTKKRYPLKRIYLLHESNVKIPKRFPFYERGRAVAQSSFSRAFDKRFRQARLTAL